MHDNAQRWYETAFSKEYLSIYSHRDENEAKSCVNLISQSISLSDSSTILDAPCGGGRHAGIFAQNGYKVFGIDLSTDLIRFAHGNKSSDSSPHYTRSDIRHLPFPAGSFDLTVNLFSSIGYFPSDTENIDTIKELIRVTKSDGYLVIDFMNAPYVETNLVPESHKTTSEQIKVHDTRWISNNPKRVNKRTVVEFSDGTERTLTESVRLFSREELIYILSDNGMSVIYEFGTYSGDSWSEESPRIILISKKNS